MNGKKGFSLVELLVVVAIMSILASVAVPMYGRYQARARQQAALGEISDYYQAFNKCVNDDENTFPFTLRDGTFFANLSCGAAPAVFTGTQYMGSDNQTTCQAQVQLQVAGGIVTVVPGSYMIDVAAGGPAVIADGTAPCKDFHTDAEVLSRIKGI